jgi:hypothetical protein
MITEAFLLERIIIAPGQSQSKPVKPTTPGDCYHDSSHPPLRETTTGWCISCLLSLYKANEVVFLSESMPYRSPLQALSALLRNMEVGRGSKYKTIQQFIEEVESMVKPAKRKRRILGIA